jgi:hypothetical protein
VSATEPLRAQVSRCIGVASPQSGTGVLGATASLRGIRIQYGLATRSAVDDGNKAGALKKTTRIEVCRVSSGSATECPASKTVPDLAWLIFDDSAKPAGKPTSTWVKSFEQAGAHEYFPPESQPPLPFDYESASNAGTFLFLKVNGESELSALNFGGWCPVVQPLNEVPKFKVLAVPSTVKDPFGGLFGDVCTQGNKSGANVTQACVDAAGTKFVVERMPDIATWQDLTLFPAVSGLAPPVPPVWANGSSKACSGQYCPTLLWLFADDYAAHGGLGQFFLGPGLSGVKNLSTDAGFHISIMGHEFFHNLQNAWNRTYGTTQQFDASMFETAPVGVDAFMCLFNYPGAKPGQCVSGRKLGEIQKGSNNATNNWLLTPNADPVSWNYTGSVFWRYAIEQYSMPTGTAAHPAPSQSAIEATNPKAVLGSRRSDEGADFLGHVFQGIKDAPSKPALDVADAVLTKELGPRPGCRDPRHAHGGAPERLLDGRSALVPPVGGRRKRGGSDPRWFPGRRSPTRRCRP